MKNEDPKTIEESNFNLDHSAISAWVIILGIVASIVAGDWYFSNHTQRSADLNNPNLLVAANGASTPNSRPGVQGAPGGTNGPAIKEPSGSASGASTGESGTAAKIDPNTQPSQDSSGVKGAPGSTNGPANSSK